MSGLIWVQTVSKMVTSGLFGIYRFIIKWYIVSFQVNIFNLSEADTKDIDRAILYALLKGKF